MLDRFISLFAPHVCLVCEREGALLCEWCGNEAIEALPERCYRCKVLSEDSRVCTSCRKKTPLDHVWVRTQYIGSARALVYVLKFARARSAAKLIAGFLDETVPYLGSEFVVTYVPTATSRVRIRGYDQSRLIAKEFARLRNLRCRVLLVRIGQSRQVRANRSQRARQAARSYLPASKNIKGIKVVLVDDILTTGASLESAAKVLQDAGTQNVYGAVFAQKQ